MNEAVTTVRPREQRRRLRWRIRAPFVVVIARLRGRPGRAALVAGGIAAAIATLVAVDGSSVIARDREVQKAVAALPAAQRSFRVDAYGLPLGVSYGQADATVSRALRTLSPRTPLRATFFRELRVGGGLVQLAGLDALDRLVRVRSGRLPRSCTPGRCEVLELGAGGRSEWREGGIDLVRVGSGDVVDRALFGESLQPAREVNGERATLLLTRGASAFERLPAFAGIGRSYSWIAPIEPRRLHVWDIERLLQRESLVQDELARNSDAYQLSGPDQALTDAQSTGRISAQRMLVLGGEDGTLLLGFALVAAMGLRRGLTAERRRLRQRGARSQQIWLALVAEVTAMTLAGALAGTAAGAAAVAFVAGRAGAPGGAILGRSLGSGLGIALVVAAWFAGTVAVLALTRVREREAGATRGMRLLDVAGLGAALAVVVGLARGGLSADTLSSGGDATFLLLLPGLVCFAAAVLVGRVLAPLMRVVERTARRGPLALRLALLALARAPARTLATAVFLLVSLGLALFAASYRATLERGARDEAGFAVPLDYTLTEGTQLVPPPLRGYPVPGYPVVRVSANVPGRGASVLTPTVLGLPIAALQRLHWRSDYSRLSQPELARRLGADGPASLRGVPVHGRVKLPVRILGAAVHLDLAVRRLDGRTSVVSLGDYGPGGWILAARLPRGTLVGLEVSLAAPEELGYTHRQAEVDPVSTPAGSLSLGPIRGVTDWRGWVVRGGGRMVGHRITYAFTEGQTVLLRRPQVTDRRPLRVVVSPEVARSAGPGGSLTLDFQQAQVPARIVGVAERFPDAEQFDEGFVIAEESNLATTLDAGMPGTGTPGEVWLQGPSRIESTLRRLPVDVASRRDLERALSSDPLARGLILTLAGAAIVALGLAAIGFWLSLVNDLRDERGELFDLETQGVAPATLRQQFRARAAALLAVGAGGGALLGFGLSRLVVALVRVSAAMQAAEPPLRFEPAWAAAGAGFGALLAVCILVAELTVRRAFRGDIPARASWSLE